MKMFRAVCICSVFASLCLFGQATRGAWWTGQTMRELNLNAEQVGRMRATLREYRPRLVELRSTVQKAEQDLETVFNTEPVDTQKANDTITRLVTARADLTRTLSELGLKLRAVLTLQQWQQVEKRFPPRGSVPPDTP